MNQKKIKTASLVIIGNEILSGRTQDKNINYIAKELFKSGISLQYVCVIPDVQKKIINTVRNLKKSYDFIITTGGIGPTHDDITAESISIAVNKKYALNKGALKELKKYYIKVKSELTDARKKMAYMPVGSRLIKNLVSGAPGFMIENIFVFAGVPSIVEAMTKEFLKIIKVKNKFYSSSIVTKLFESKIAHILEEAEKTFDEVSIGSYPIFDGKPRGVEVIISSMTNRTNALKARKYILREINKII
ncbi:MAG: competence/damage-inducible protein A [Alphaproteobacteria bacterium]